MKKLRKSWKSLEITKRNLSSHPEFAAKMLRNANWLNTYVNYSEQFGIKFKIDSKSHISLYNYKLDFLVGIFKKIGVRQR